MKPTSSVPWSLPAHCALFLALSALAAEAQATTAAISGTVRDGSGGVVSGASVTVTHAETGARRVLVSDGEGRYEAAGLPLGGYAVRAEHDGFQASVRTGIALGLGRHAVVDLTLAVGAMTTEIEVQAEAPLVDARRSTLAGLVDQETIRNLPLNARTFVQLTTLEPGVQEFKNVGEPTSTFPGSGRGMRITVNGVRPEMNNYLIDGVDVGDAYNNSPGGAAGLFLGVETLREFQVLTSTYGAEFGRVGGGIINAVTRWGGNELHGSVFEFHRNDSMDSRNYFDAPDAKPEFRRNQFGAVLSGPLVKDRTFFLVSYEGLRERLGRTLVSVVPDDAARRGVLPDPAAPGRTVTVPVSPVVQPYLALYPRANRDPAPGDGVAEYAFPFQQPTDQDFFTARIDHKLSDRHSVFARYIFDRASVLRPLSFPQFAVDERTRNHYAVVEQQSVLASSLLHTLRLGLTRTGFDSRDRELTPVDPSLSFVAGRPFGTLVVGGLSNLGITTFGPTNTPTQTLYTVSDSLTYTKGRHSLKLGASLHRFEIDETNSLIDNGLWNFFSLQNLLQNRPFAYLGLQPGADVSRKFRQWLIGAYVQDDLRLTRDLTLNLGLRFERLSVPTEADGKVANLRDPARDARPAVGGPLVSGDALETFAPRFGFAWSPGGSRRTAVRGGAGLFYNQPGYSYFFRALMYTPPFAGFGALPAPPVGPPFVAFPRVPPQLVPANITFPTQFDLDTPRVFHYNLNVQHELGAGVVASVGYVGSRGTRLGRVTEVNTFRFQTVDGRKVFVPGPRINPSWVGLNVIDTQGRSWYDSIQLALSRRYGRGLRFQASYTYGHCIDDSPPLLRDVESSSNIVMDALDGERDRGHCNSDVRHNLTLSYSWDLPLARSATGLTRKLLGGWQLSGITTLRSGTPFTVENGFDRARTGKLGPFLTDRPNLAPGASNNPVLGGPDRYFDPAAFVLQPAGVYGDLGRNTLIGPGLQNWDVSLVKTQRLAGKVDFQLRLEVFNLFNRANFSVPTGPGRIAFLGATPGPGAEGVRNPVAGRIFKTVTAARQFQVGVKLLF